MVSKGHLPAHYVIIKVYPPTPWNFPLHPTPPIYNLFILCLTNPPLLLVLESSIQRGKKLDMKRLQQEQQQCWWLCVQVTRREKIFETDNLVADTTDADDLNMDIQRGSGAKDTSWPLFSANPPISVSAPKPISYNMDSISVFPNKIPSFAYQNVYPPM